MVSSCCCTRWTCVCRRTGEAACIEVSEALADLLVFAGQEAVAPVENSDHDAQYPKKMA